MTRERKPQSRAIPQSRLARLGRLGAPGSGVIGGMAAKGARRVAQGERPCLNDMLLTPANAVRVADPLAQMRSAAMKVGQTVSMEAGDILPPEWAAILARLRDQADSMPPQQLKTVLIAEWDADFLKRCHRFDTRPIAAASIGQVHRVTTNQ